MKKTPLQGRALRAGTAVLLAALMTTQLSACFPLAAAGIAATTLAAIDRRTLGAQADDQSIELRAASRISERYGDRAHINITSYNRKVLITGEVPDAPSKVGIESIVAGVDSVLSTVNELLVGPPSSLTTRGSDTLITGQAKASLVDSKDIFANAFKVVTERGTVFLMGRVTQAEGNRAASAVRNVRGVERVVKVFDYITEQELASMQAQPAPEGRTPPAPAR